MQDVLQAGYLLQGVGQDEPFLQGHVHIASHVEICLYELQPGGEVICRGVEVAEPTDLLSQPPVVKVFDVANKDGEVITGAQ